MLTQPTWMTQGYEHIWLPYAQMKTCSPALAVASTAGSRIHLADGRELIDGIASWWTACHGYNHPHIAAAVRQQLELMPHVMFGGMVHEPALKLAKRLSQLLGGGLNRVFFTESGSVSVEVAIKMAMQFWRNQGQSRARILSFKGGYHGDTFGTMAVSDPDTGMHAAFSGMLPEHDSLALPQDAQTDHALTSFLEKEGHTVAAMLVEPLIQGAGGMLIHPPSVLRRLRELCDQHGILLIFDEIFTGFGRTGTLFAFQQSGIQPDILTLSKALTGGTLPLAATVANQRVFDAFWSDDPSHALMHGPTFMGNALACATANASLDLFEQAPRLEQAKAIETALQAGLAPCRTLDRVRDVRVLGAIGVVELTTRPDREALRQRFIDEGVWIRPFGNVVYLTPCLNIDEADLNTLMSAVFKVLSRL